MLRPRTTNTKLDTSSASAQLTIQANNLINCNSCFLLERRVSSFLSHLGEHRIGKQTYFSAKASLSWRLWQFHRKLDFVLDRRRHSAAPGGATVDRGRGPVRFRAALSSPSRWAMCRNHCCDGRRRPSGNHAIVESKTKGNRQEIHELDERGISRILKCLRKQFSRAFSGVWSIPWTFFEDFILKANISRNEISVLTIAKMLIRPQIASTMRSEFWLTSEPDLHSFFLLNSFDYLRHGILALNQRNRDAIGSTARVAPAMVGSSRLVGCSDDEARKCGDGDQTTAEFVRTDPRRDSNSPSRGGSWEVWKEWKFLLHVKPIEASLLDVEVIFAIQHSKKILIANICEFFFSISSLKNSIIQLTCCCCCGGLWCVDGWWNGGGKYGGWKSAGWCMLGPWPCWLDGSPLDRPPLPAECPV